MANFIKKILSGIGILALVLVILVVIADDDTPTQPQQNAGYGNEVDDNNGDDGNNDDYYFLELEDGEEVGIAKPRSILDDIYANLNDQRMESLFTSIYNYNYNRDDVYIAYIPDAEQTLREMVKEPYTIGSVFNVDMQVTGNPGVIGIVSGYIQGDDSLGMMDMDMSYIGDEKYDLMDGDIVTFDAVYAGLDTGSTPVFIALSMNVQ